MEICCALAEWQLFPGGLICVLCICFQHHIIHKVQRFEIQKLRTFKGPMLVISYGLMWTRHPRKMPRPAVIFVILYVVQRSQLADRHITQKHKPHYAVQPCSLILYSLSNYALKLHVKPSVFVMNNKSGHLTDVLSSWILLCWHLDEGMDVAVRTRPWASQGSL